MIEYYIRKTIVLYFLLICFEITVLTVCDIKTAELLRHNNSNFS